MTTMMKAKKTKTPAPTITAGEDYKEIGTGLYAIEHIEVQSNFRKTFNEKLLKELAGNIAKVGVLQPIIVRRGRRPSCWFLVAGERRLRAAQMAGLKEIPARELDLTEEQALEVQALENLHRKDLSPIEEARAFKVLLDQKGHTLEQVEDLASRVGKSVAYVYRAVRLLELPENFLDRIESGELTPAHGRQLLRLPPEARKDAINNIAWDQPASEIVKDIDREMGADLTHCAFPLDKPYGGKGACNDCTFNSGNQGMLFTGAAAGKCTDKACFDKKQAAAVEDFRKQKEPSFPGLKFLGVESGYCGRTFNGAQVVEPKAANSKEVKAAVKASPGSFAWFIVDRTTSGYGERGMFARLCCTNTKALTPAVRKALSPGPSCNYNGEPRKPATTPKQKFVRMETYKALFTAARATLSKGLQNEHYTAICQQLEPGHYNTRIPLELLNVKEKKGKFAWQTEYAYDVMTTDELRDLALLLALNERCGTANDPDPKVFMAVGVDAKTVMAKAKKDAEAAWDAQKGKKPAKAAK